MTESDSDGRPTIFFFITNANNRNPMDFFLQVRRIWIVRFSYPLIHAAINDVNAATLA
jgi:hypothetical protein